MNELFNKDQWLFISKHFEQTKNDKIIEDMSRLKSFIPSGTTNADQLDEHDVFINMWELKVNRADKRIYQCICGKKIKNEYQLTHRKKDITLCLGEVHYKKYCGVNVAKVEKISELNQKYISALEELVELVQQREFEKQKYLLYLEGLPLIMREQLELGIPLLKSQMEALERSSLMNKRVIRCVRNIEKMLLDHLDKLSDSEKKSFIVRLKNGDEITSLSQLNSINYGDIIDRDFIAKTTVNGVHSYMENKTVNETDKNSLSADFSAPKSENANKFNSMLSDTSSAGQRERFLTSIKDENERNSIIKNTNRGINKITVRSTVKYPSKVQRQVVLGLSLSDKQMERHSNPQETDDDFWSKY